MNVIVECQWIKESCQWRTHPMNVNEFNDVVNEEPVMKSNNSLG